MNKGKAYLAAGQPGMAVSYLTRSLTYRDLDLTHSYLGEAYATLAAAAAASKDEAIKAEAASLITKTQSEAELTRQMNPYHLT